MLNSINTFIKGFAAKILLVLLVLSFAVWGIGDMLRGPGAKQEVATVGDVTITMGEYARHLQREKETMQQRLGQYYSPDILNAMQLPQQVMERLIQRALLLQEAQALGLMVSDTDIARNIHTNLAFHDTKGNFSKELFATRLKNSGLSEKSYVEDLRRQLAVEMLVNTLRQQAPIHEKAVETLYLSRNQQRNITLYVMAESLVPPVSDPDDDALEAYYKANESKFSAPEYRTLSYVRFTGESLKDQIVISPEELQAVYDERVEEFRQPEQRSVEQLLFNDKELAQEAIKLANSGSSFADIAKAKDAMNKDSISLGDITRDGLFEEAADAVFALKENEVSQPVNSPFGWHVFRVSSIKPEGVQPFESVREKLETELRHFRQDEVAGRMADDLDDAIASGSTLAEAATGLGLALHTLPPVDSSGVSPHNVTVQIPELDGFLDTAFELDEQMESTIRFSNDGSYFVVRVDKITPARLKPLDEVKADVITAWKQTERMKKLITLAKEMEGKLADPKTRLSVAKKHKIKIVNASAIKRSAEKVAGYALPPVMMADLFVRARGDITPSYRLKEDTYAIGAVSAIKQAAIPDDGEQQALDEIRTGLIQAKQGEITQQYLNYLQQKFPVAIDQSALASITQEP